DGRRVYSGGEDGTVRVWDLKTTEQLRSWGRPGEPVQALALSPDGTRVLGACGKVLRLWNVEDGRELAILPGEGESRGDKGWWTGWPSRRTAGARSPSALTTTSCACGTWERGRKLLHSGSTACRAAWRCPRMAGWPPAAVAA